MYCSTCAAPLASGLSYCNRCGVSLKERAESSPDTVGSYLTSITVIGVGGLGVMLGGAIALKNGAQLPEEIIGIFMLMCFLIIAIIEIFLCRQLSRVVAGRDSVTFAAPPQGVMPAELRGPADLRALPHSPGEPISSVTENTTRTLDYSRTEPTR